MNEPKVKVRVEEQLGIITFDDKDNAMNTWTEEMQMGFLEAIYKINDLVDERKVEGVIIISGKPNTFCSGGNLKSMSAGTVTRLDKARGIEFLQSIMKRISEIKVPTLAAINGHCLGGGLELALACSARIARKSKTTILGLPEAGVGIFPGSGGTQRLPRLIGYPAIDLVLESKLLTAEAAFNLGIVDECLPENANLLVEAEVFIKDIIDGSVKLNRPVQKFPDLDEVINETRQKLLKRTKGRLLPGPKAILKLMSDGLKGSLDEGLNLEKRLYVDVAMSPEAMGSINAFFLKELTDKPKKLMTPEFSPKEINKLAVLGFGTMGRGVVISAISNMQVPVVVKDSPEALEAGIKFVLKILTGLYEKKRIKKPPQELLKYIIPTSEFGEEFADVDFAIEAIYENMEAKIELYQALCKAVSEDCLVASNTSGLLIDEIAKFVTNPSRFGGLHFFSPVWIMELVEIVRGEKTSQATIDNFLNFAGLIRKRPLICTDSPGFVVNAVLRPLMRVGLECIEEGNPIETVDNAFTAYGLPVGPIKLIDEIGIDVVHHIFENRGEEQKTLRNMFQAGYYGLKKNGKGFYQSGGTADPYAVDLIDKRALKLRTDEEITNVLLKEQITIGKNLLDRKVVDHPKWIDIGMIYGTGYPKDKGGPLKWADLTGLSTSAFGKTFYD